MRILLLYPPPWKFFPTGEPPSDSEAVDGPWVEERVLDGDMMVLPYGLLTLASAVSAAGRETTTYNLSTFHWKNIRALLEHLPPQDVVGVSVFTGSRHGAGAVAALVRELHPDAHIVMGGPHVTALPQKSLQCWPDVDSVVIGEGESTFIELLDRLEAGRSLDSTPGLAWRDGEEIRIGPVRERIRDLDSVPDPHRNHDSFIVLTSRGCPGACTFCGSRGMWGTSLRFHSTDYVLDLLENLVTVHGRLVLAIKDDTFTSNRKRAIAICEGILERGLNFLWSCDTRADALNEDVLRAMRRAGCQRISLGVESGSPEILRNINKRVTPDQVVAATAMACRFGFQVRHYLMIGNRGETAETVQATFDLVRRAKPNEFLVSPLVVYPGTRDFEIAQEAGLVTTETLFDPELLTPGFIVALGGELDDAREWLNAHPGVQYFRSYTVEERAATLELFPDLAAARMDLAGALYEAGRFDEAEPEVRRAIEMGHPLPGLGLNYIALIRAGQGDLQATVEMLMEASQLGRHAIVEDNLRSIRAWIDSGGPASGKQVTLSAHHDFERLQTARQPIMPAAIQLQ